MMKKTLMLLSLLTTITLTAQEVIATQGDSYSNGNGSIDFTVGEVVINTGTDGTNDITQGFHQTNWYFLEIDDHSPALEVMIYPNPTSEVINIRTSEFEGASFALYDANGKIVLYDLLVAELTEIQVGTLLPGEYLLRIKKDDQKLKTFKLVKIH
jgi:hypothetical protein